MRTRLILLIISTLVLFGCATSKGPSEVAQLQIKVAQLERKIDEKDQTIEELQSEVKELSGQVEEIGMDISDSKPTIEIPSAKVKTSSFKVAGSDTDIIRVPVSVEQVQTALKNAGYYDGAIDGKLGTKSKNAIKVFQKDHELVVDGVIGKKTWDQMKGYLQ